MIKDFRAHFSAWLMISVVAISACGQKTASDQKIGSVPPGSSGAQGTVDGGGGAGYNGLPLESYHDDIRNLPEYKTYVAPILAAIGKINPDFENVILHIVKDRTWLFMKAPIPKISDARQGSPFNLDQWAAQNSKEIWFSDQYKGSEKERGRILLHEILVGLKIMRFLSYNEYCFAWTTDRKLCDGSDANDVLIQDYKLDDLDHEDVRSMGDWLWDNYPRMSAADFGHLMHVYQFQSAHFIWKMPEIKIEDSRVINPTLNHVLAKNLNLYTGFNFDRIATAKCAIEFKTTDPAHVEADIRILDIKSGKLLRHLNYKVNYDPNVQMSSSLTFSVYARTFNANLGDGHSLKALGDRQRELNFEFAEEEVRSFGAVENRFDSTQNGVSSSKGNYSAPEAVFCTEEAVELPWNYGAWLEMRAPDRDFLEKRFYHGKTREERLLETMTPPSV